MKTDIKGQCFKALRNLKINTNRIISTFFTIIELSLKGVEFGKGNKFFGCPIISRYQNSRITIGNNCNFRSDKISNLIGIYKKCILATLRKNAEVKIGNNCGISGASISGALRIIIEDNVLIGANTVITDFDWHNIEPDKRKERCESADPVWVKKNVFIGAGVFVLKGVTIGENSVIGANSVVVKDVPANVIAAGNPCKVIKNI
jgi:acetyltransferase-like isoleucine patch superfamily enzyme